MPQAAARTVEPDPPFSVLRPAAQTLAMVLASPHSGAAYAPEFIAASRLDPLSLRRSEDAYVDELFGAGPRLGAPLLKALFPRAYVDPNREPYELDPDMFSDALPPYANTRSARVAVGLGTIARVVTDGAEIYRGKLPFAEAQRRIEVLYMPYHAQLERLTDETLDRFGRCLLIDCHSMPSVGGPVDRDPGRARVDMVLGDCHGVACAPIVAERAEAVLRGLGYSVACNNPYAGGFTTRHYGKPALGLHALQVEVNRALYMDERTLARKAYFSTMTTHMTELIAALGEAAAALETR